jgi:hypothetical protein
LNHKIVWLTEGGTNIDELDAESFDLLKSSREQLIAALDIEENFNGLIDRYIALQREIADIVIKTAARGLIGWSHLRSVSQRLNREIACLLSAARQYIDYAKHSFSVAGWDAPRLRSWLSKEYDERLGYRACEEIRDASQHRLLATQSISLGNKWVGDAPETFEMRQHDGTLYVMPAVFRREDPKFKRSILDELAQIADDEGRVAFGPLLRDYLNGLAVVNARIRKTLASEISSCSAVFDRALQERATEYIKILAIEGKKTIEEFPIFRELPSRYEELLSLNSSHARKFDFKIVC